MIKKIHNFKFVIRNCQKGMTYVELIVVLSIFAVMSSIVLFNHGKFQAKVDIKNLANDIALKIVQAQKDAMSGKIPVQTIGDSWRPSYGVYFDLSYPKSFIYFADSNNNNYYDYDSTLDTIPIIKNNTISNLEVIGCSPTESPTEVANLSIVFKRPDSGALINNLTGTFSCDTIEYAKITVSSSDDSFKGYIKIYPSGRIQVN